MKKRISQFMSGAAGGSFQQPMQIENPIVIMFRSPGEENNVTCHIHPTGYNYQEFGLLICDLVRHVARAFKVDEDDVWEWVDKERERSTTELTSPS